MALYELRTYTLFVGKMGEAVRIYQELGWPALEPYKDKLVGYFQSDAGALNQLIHLWKFDDDADRRRHWSTLYGDEAFMRFASNIRPLIQSQSNQLLLAAPWGPHP